MWDTSNAERLYNWNHQRDTNSQITATAFSPDGKFAATADQSTLVLWDTNSGQALRFFTAPAEIYLLELGPNADTALLGMSNGQAILFDSQKGGIIHEMNQGNSIVSMAMSGNGKYALFGLDQSRINYWELGSATLLREIATEGRVNTVAISDNGEFGFTAIQHIDAVLWDLKTGSEVSTLNYSNRFFPSFSSFVVARFSADGSSLLTGNTTGAVELWTTDTGDRIQRWITPMPSGIAPTVFTIVAVAHQENGHVFAMNSKGTSFKYAQNISN